jgi:hypothetical protein
LQEDNDPGYRKNAAEEQAEDRRPPEVHDPRAQARKRVKKFNRLIW